MALSCDYEADKKLHFKIMGYYTDKYTPEPRGHYKYKHQKFLEICEVIFNNEIIQNWVDLGCGDGTLTYKLSKYCKQMVGVDIDDKKINFAKKVYPNISFKKSSIIEELNKMDDDSIDVISENDVFYYFSEDMLSETIREIERVLKRKGVFIASSIDANIILKINEKLMKNNIFIGRKHIIDVQKLFWLFEYPFIKLEYLYLNRKDINEAKTNRYKQIMKIMDKYPKSFNNILILLKVPRKIIAKLYNSLIIHKITLVSRKNEMLFCIFKKV